MIQLKDDVKLCGIRPEMVNFIDALHLYFRRMLKKPLVITSVTDGLHMLGSKHYKGLAIDLRIWHLSDQDIRCLRSWFVDNYDKLFDFVLEKNHIHIEYDPH